MQLYILDKNPIISASHVPDKYKFKMLIELGQLLASAGITTVYKPIKQGKELQAWVSTYRAYTYSYFDKLLRWSKSHVNMKLETLVKLEQIGLDLADSIGKVAEKEPTHAYFRYAKEYKCDVASKTLLPISVCIEYYKDYLAWKVSYIPPKKNINIIIEPLEKTKADIKAELAFEEYLEDSKLTP